MIRLVCTYMKQEKEIKTYDMTLTSMYCICLKGLKLSGSLIKSLTFACSLFCISLNVNFYHFSKKDENSFSLVR